MAATTASARYVLPEPGTPAMDTMYLWQVGHHGSPLKAQSHACHQHPTDAQVLLDWCFLSDLGVSASSSTCSYLFVQAAALELTEVARAAMSSFTVLGWSCSAL